MIHQLALKTTEGEFTALYNDHGLCGLGFPKSVGKSRNNAASEDVPRRVRAWHKLTAAALARALEGKDPGKLPPLDTASGTNFQRQVWHALREIACGQTRSYGEIAVAIGNPKAVRAVGGACGANPIPVFIPCHRVLAAHQQIGGFSSDPKWKRILLEREGVLLQF
jgi:O-6-methylguanine DNA methyltransferase